MTYRHLINTLFIGVAMLFLVGCEEIENDPNPSAADAQAEDAAVAPTDGDEDSPSAPTREELLAAFNAINDDLPTAQDPLEQVVALEPAVLPTTTCPCGSPTPSADLTPMAVDSCGLLNSSDVAYAASLRQTLASTAKDEVLQRRDGVEGAVFLATRFYSGPFGLIKNARDALRAEAAAGRVTGSVYAGFEAQITAQQTRFNTDRTQADDARAKYLTAAGKLGDAAAKFSEAQSLLSGCTSVSNLLSALLKIGEGEALISEATVLRDDADALYNAWVTDLGELFVALEALRAAILAPPAP